MSETLIVASGGKEEKYRVLMPQIKALVENESDLIAVLGNISSAICSTFHPLWVGFYLVKPMAGNAGGDIEELVLGPFQGSLACTRICKGRGVCGTAWKEAKTQIVPDVLSFPGHIACSSLSRSEIVVPMLDAAGCVRGVLDMDSDRISAFDDTDKRYLEEICALVVRLFFLLERY